MQETTFFGLFGRTDKQHQVQTAKPDSKALTPQNALSTNNYVADKTDKPAVEDWRISESRRIAMVSKTDTYCRAYDGNGDVMNISLYDCLYASANPRTLKSAPDDKRDRYLQADNYRGSAPAHQDNLAAAGSVAQPAEISATHKQTF